MEERTDAAVLEWARRVPVSVIPGVLVFLAARLLAEGDHASNGERNWAAAGESEKLLTAGELAERLRLPESWLRSEERGGRIPSIRAGKYVRFKAADVERALAERARQVAQNR